jgi:hypothetical protein
MRLRADSRRDGKGGLFFCLKKSTKPIDLV